MQESQQQMLGAKYLTQTTRLKQTEAILWDILEKKKL